MTGRILVACVGNVLRRDDGFGVRVAEVFERDPLPGGVDLIETGIGGMSVVHQLIDRYDALIVVDAVDRGEAPGTVWVLEPEIPEPSEMDPAAWRALFSNLHLAEPYRILLLARSLGVLPGTVRLVGCQPLDAEAHGEGLSEPVARAVAIAARQVRRLAEQALAPATVAASATPVAG